MKLALALVLPVAALVIAVPKDSEACSCSLPGERFFAPMDGQTGVPTNTRLWSGAWGGADPALSDEEGNLIPGTTEELLSNAGTILVFTPSTELTLGGRYSFHTWAGPQRFTVDRPADHEAPEPPVETAQETIAKDPDFDFFGLGGESSCGNSGYYAVTVTLQGEHPIKLIDVNGASTLDGLKDQASVTAFGYYDEPVRMGQGACLYSWPGSEEEDQASFRYATFDLAGNFSGWGEESPVDVPSAGCSCSAAKTHGSSGVLLPALLAGLWALTRAVLRSSSPRSACSR
jgi:hypothetical protein